jgi:hypothetical protein
MQDNVVVARDIQAAQLTQIQSEAKAWAYQHQGQVPDEKWVSTCQQYFPKKCWDNDWYDINDWKKGWKVEIYYYVYLYTQYTDYHDEWNQYFPDCKLPHWQVISG